MAPVVHGLEDKYGMYLDFVYLDIDDSATQAIRDQLNYSNRWRPYLLFVNQQGEVVGSPFIGFQDGAIVEAALQDFLVQEGVFAQ